MVAIVAPSILAQFGAPVDQVYGAIKSLGFLEVVEVAQGAMETTRHEPAMRRRSWSRSCMRGNRS